MNIYKIFLFCVASILPLFYVSLIKGRPSQVNSRIVRFGLLAGIMAALSIVLIKTLLPNFGPITPIKETLTLALFVSLIEAGLLEEVFKNGAYLLAFSHLNKTINFSENKYFFFALGALVGLGFGILENAYYSLSPELGKFNILFDRVFTTIPAHIIMNSTFGFLHSKKVNLIVALIISIFIHGIYDFFALPSTLLGSLLVKTVLLLGFGFVLYMGHSLIQKKSPVPQDSN